MTALLTITPETLGLVMLIMATAGLIGGFLLGREHERNQWGDLLGQARDNPSPTPLRTMLAFGTEIEEGRP